jgi:hypothetical protein
VLADTLRQAGREVTGVLPRAMNKPSVRPMRRKAR